MAIQEICGNPVVVINAAGKGSRLGLGIPKSLVKVCGCPIVEWQLRLLCRSVKDVRLIVGFDGDSLADFARSVRPDITIIRNSRWQETKTAASLSLGMEGVTSRCISLDGDLLVAPEDFEAVLQCNTDCIGVTQPCSEQPVFVEVTEGLARQFSYSEPSDFEWTGIVNFRPVSLLPSDGNVFEMIRPILPLKIVHVRCAEIDTQNDYLSAIVFWEKIIESHHA